MGFKTRSRKSEEGAPEWLLTYSDVVTLVLTLFVFIYSFSVVDVQKFKEFITSFQAIGIFNMGEAPLTGGGPPIQTGPVGPEINQELPVATQVRLQQMMQEAQQKVERYLQENGLSGLAEVRLERGGVAIDIKERILFASGKADLKPEARGTLDRLAGLFRELDYGITVEGHTDNRPIHTVEFPTNWELSAARATAVVRYLVDYQHIDPKRFTAVGYGEYRPIASNQTPEGQALNRRVVLLLNVLEAWEKEVLHNGGNKSSK